MSSFGGALFEVDVRHLREMFDMGAVESLLVSVRHGTSLDTRRHRLRPRRIQCKAVTRAVMSHAYEGAGIEFTLDWAEEGR